MLKQDIYQLLKINDKTPAVVVKKKFKAFALKNHPDLFPEDKAKEEIFKLVAAEYHNWKLVQTTLKKLVQMKSFFNHQNFSDVCHDQNDKRRNYSWVA